MSEVTASSFGKLSSMDDPKREARQEDLCLALLKMITAQITNLAANIAKLHGVSRVFFVGGFLRFNEISRPQVRPRIPALPCELSSRRELRGNPGQIAYFCKRFFNIQALFLRHADFLGAIGALDEASRDLGLGVSQTRTKGRGNSPRHKPGAAAAPGISAMQLGETAVPTAAWGTPRAGGHRHGAAAAQTRQMNAS